MELTLELLHSLQKTTYPNYEIIVVDNGSTDGSVDAVREAFESVRIVENERNLGYSKGMNRGIIRSKGEYVVTLNNDMVVHPDWLSELVKVAISDDKFGIVGSMLLDYTTPKKIHNMGWLETSKFPRKHACVPIGHGETDCGQYLNPIEVSYTNGLIKRSAISETKMFDEKMFVFFEENDLCYRMKKAGFKIVVAPKSKIWHKGSATIRRGTYLPTYEYHKNELRYLLKNYEKTDKIVASILYFLLYLSKMLFYLIKGKNELSKAIFDSILWNVKNRKDYY